VKLSQKVLTSIGGFVASFIILSTTASAHVVVKPAEALTGSYQTFVISAPNEKDIAYTTIKLVIPEGVQGVMPTAKAGWTITTDKTGEGETATVNAVTWEGNVDGGFRDEFSFSAKLPDNPTELDWKAYQTYSDGTTVSWDQKQSSDSHDGESETSGPLSVTKVVSESTADTATADGANDTDSAKNTAQLSLYLAIASLVLSLVLLVRVAIKR
jgi:uncharacterized protein YcnI